MLLYYSKVLRMPSNSFTFQIGIIGPASPTEYPRGGGATPLIEKLAYETAAELARRGALVVTGGKSGVMNAAARGAKENNGVTIGVVKGPNRRTSNQYTDIEVISGMAANGFDELLLINMCDAVIAIGGGAGTLEEIAIAYRNNIPIVALASNSKGWGDRLAGTYIDERKNLKIVKAASPASAARKACALALHNTSS